MHKPHIVLGISGHFHDAAAVLLIDGVVAAATQEERFTRRKHDPSTPVRAAEYCMRRAEVGLEDVSQVVFYEKPLWKFTRIVEQHLTTFPKSAPSFARAMRSWLSGKVFTRKNLAQELGVDEEKISFSEHHVSHAASVFLPADVPSAAVLTVDGVGEEKSTVIHHAKMNEGRLVLEELASIDFPHSLGLLYSAMTAFLGFEVNGGEYKVMGLAAYGRPTLLSAIESVAHLSSDGSFDLDMDYFLFHRHPEKSFDAHKLGSLLGTEPREPGTTLVLDGEVDAATQRYADIAASLQAFCEKCMICWANIAQRLTGEKVLCLAGGVAQNCVAVGVLGQVTAYEKIFVPAAPGDAGGALGAALAYHHTVMNTGSVRPKNPFLGLSNRPEDIGRFLRDCKIPHAEFESEEALHEEIVTAIDEGCVGALCRARAEWGPRALGARSIIADPRRQDVRDRINTQVKYREKFRPFAPSILEFEADQYFDIPSSIRTSMETMAAAVPARSGVDVLLPAVVHQNGRSRVHLVNENAEPQFRRLLLAMKRRTGIGCLLNTSFNLHDEPIVNTYAEAFATFVRSDLDFLVLENFLITREDLAPKQSRPTSQTYDGATLGKRRNGARP